MDGSAQVGSTLRFNPGVQVGAEVPFPGRSAKPVAWLNFDSRIQTGLKLTLDLEYLWKAAHCFHSAGSKDAEKWVMARLRMLLEGVDASAVAGGIRRSATLQQLKRRDGVDACADYLIKHRELLRYGDALRDGLPIATGVIEGACRYIVRDRMDKTGARWSVAGAEAVLELRALRTNGDFDAYWQHHVAAEYQRNHASRYADEQVPSPLPAKRHLRRIK